MRGQDGALVKIAGKSISGIVRFYEMQFIKKRLCNAKLVLNKHIELFFKTKTKRGPRRAPIKELNIVFVCLSEVPNS